MSYANQENGATITHYFTDKSEAQTHAVSVYAVDNLTTGAGTTITVATEEVPFSWNKDRIGVGGVPQTAKSFEVADGWSIVGKGKQNNMAYLPYSFNAYWSTGNLGWTKIATITITENYCDAPIEFIVQRRFDKQSVKLSVLFASGETKDPTLTGFYYDTISGTYGTNAFMAVIDKAQTSVWNIYVNKANANDQIGVYTLASAFTQTKCSITYSQARVPSAPATSILATQLPLINTAKNNTMAYMPYTWETAGVSGSAGYARIASITVFQNWVYGNTTFTVSRSINDARPVKLYLEFQTGSSLSASNVWFYYDSIEGTGGTTFDAFVYQASSDTLDVYVQKSHQNDWLTVTVEPNSYVQSRCNFTYVNDLMSSVPASAWKAKPLGFTSPLTSTKAPILRFQIPASSTRRITGTSNGECALLLGCTGWNSTMRRGLWWISGYADSSRADVIYLLGNYTNSQITITAVSGQLAWDIANVGNTTALIGITSLYGAMPTVT